MLVVVRAREPDEGGAAVVPAVMSGDNQIGFSNVTSIMNGKAQNLPLKPIAAGVSGAETEDKAAGWRRAPDSLTAG